MAQQISPELQKQLLDALRSGRKDEAHRLFREATGASERVARLAIFAMSVSGVSRMPADPSAEADSADESVRSAPTPPASVTPPTPPEAARVPGEGSRGAVRAASGCGSVILLAFGPLLLAAATLLLDRI